MSAALSQPSASPRLSALGTRLIFTGLLALLTVGPIVMALPALPPELFDAGQWRDFLLDHGHRQILLRTLIVALLATGLAGLLAMPPAFVLAQAGPPIRRLVLVLAVTPLLVPPFLWAALTQELISLLAPLPAGDLLGAPWHLLIPVYALHLSPVILLALVAARVRADRAQAETARCHGIGPFTAWYRMTLPQLMPAFVLGGTVVFLRVLADVGAPVTLGVEGLLARQVIDPVPQGPVPGPSAQVAVLLVGISAGIVALTWRFLVAPRGPIGAPTTDADRAGSPLWAVFAVALGAGIATLPLVGLGITLRDVAPPADLVGRDPAAWQGSLRIATTAALALAVPGVIAVTLIQSGGWAGRVVRGLLPLSLVVPTPVLAWLHGDVSIGSPAIESMLVAGIAAVLPLLVLAPHLGAHLRLVAGREAIELARSAGTATVGPVFATLLPGHLRLLGALMMIGFALGLTDLGAALPAPPHLAIGLATGDPTMPADAWSTGVLVLLTAVAVLAMGAGLLLRRRIDTDRTVTACAVNP